MFIVLLTYVAELSEVEKHLADHLAYLDRCYAQGVFIASGPKVPRTGGLILAVSPTRDALEVILADDPFIQQGIAQYEMTEFVPRKTAPLFEVLIGA
ncbi:MAG TPA: GTP cyclohydrolase [Gammaproteobacteria bacterium]|nr:GTP cyclohydrolase [Gammaproteobacteria bacterium]